MHWIGAIAILGMLALLVLFYLMRGMVRLEGGRSGRTITRFSAFERFVHWMTATCFIILGADRASMSHSARNCCCRCSEPETFTDMAQWAKYAHNFLSFPFTLGVILIFLMWIAWQYPERNRHRLAQAGGGIIGHEHPPAKRFNARPERDLLDRRARRTGSWPQPAIC